MYEFIGGTLEIKQTDYLVIENNGIGYRMKISRSTFEHLPEIGEQVKVYTHLHVREDIFDLFGFAQKNERAFFHKLIAISKIGPKAALAILSGGSPEEISNWILAEDAKAIARTPGIGPTTAKRIILELKPKIQKGLVDIEPGALTGTSGTSDSAEEATMALEALGYSRTDIYSRIRKVLQETHSDLTTEQLIKKVLKK